MNQVELARVLENLVGEEVKFIHHPGATPIIGILTMDKNMIFEVNNDITKTRFHYMDVDVILANKVLGTKNTICGWILESIN